MEIEPSSKQSKIESSDTAAFHCCAERHLARLKPRAALVYPFALRISKHSKRFACSASSVGDFLGLHRTTVLRAYHQLADIGFFELLERGHFDVNIYRVLRHDEWANEHPGLCATKSEFPWTGDGDPLGQKLYAISGARVKFKEFQVKEYRATGLDESTIVLLFDEFRSGTGKYRKPRNVPYHFLMHLRSIAAERRTLPEGPSVDIDSTVSSPCSSTG